jgi:hypothetical protein
MPKRTEPPPKADDDSLEKLAEFTKRILQVPRSEVRDKPDSTGKPIDELCPETMKNA